MYPLPRLRRFAAVAAAALALTLTGCATMRVSSFVERGADFTRYRTFDWDPAGLQSTGDPRLDNNPFFHDRVREDVEKILAARGFEKATSGTPDLLIHIHASVVQKIDVTSADTRYGSCDGCKPFVYDAGTLLLDFVDARTNKLAWRGWAEDSFDKVVDNQAWMEEEVDKAVAQILERLPRRL